MKGLWARVGAFIAGFSFVYIIMGVSVAFVGALFRVYINWFLGVAGIILILFGLHVGGILRISFLDKPLGGMDKARDPRNFIGAFLVGIAFAIGWSPCTGPILAAILTLAASQTTVVAGGFLLLAFCFGLGVPFLLTALAVNKFLNLFNKLQRQMRKIEIASAILLILVGLLFLTQTFNLFRGLGGISLGGVETNLGGAVKGGISIVAIGAAMLAGVLSFISPCVLPLLPSYIAFIAGTTDIESLTGKR